MELNHGAIPSIAKIRIRRGLFTSVYASAKNAVKITLPAGCLCKTDRPSRLNSSLTSSPTPLCDISSSLTPSSTCAMTPISFSPHPSPCHHVLPTFTWATFALPRSPDLAGVAREAGATPPLAPAGASVVAAMVGVADALAVNLGSSEEEEAAPVKDIALSIFRRRDSTRSAGKADTGRLHQSQFHFSGDEIVADDEDKAFRFLRTKETRKARTETVGDELIVSC